MPTAIRLLSTYKGNKPGTIVTVDDAVATQLLAGGVNASADLTGGVLPLLPAPVAPASNSHLNALAVPKKHAALNITAVNDYRPFCESAPGVYVVAASFAKQLATFTGDVTKASPVTGAGGNTVISTKFNWNDTTAAQGLYNNDGTTLLGGANAVIQQVWKLSTGTMLMLTIAHNATPAHAPFYLHRVMPNFDCGTAANNRRASLHLGAIDAAGVGAPTPGIRALHQRSLCEFTRNNGTKVVLMAEYNVAGASSNTPRTPGGANDQMTAWISTDDGVSFSRLVQFNTGGVHRFSHFHGVVYNKYTRRVYFLIGDVNDENAVVAWDGESAAPAGANAEVGNNPSHAQIGSAPGWAIAYGNELCRYGDLIFSPDGDIIGLPDSDTNPELDGSSGLGIPAKGVDAYVACKMTHRLETIVAGRSIQRHRNIPPLIGLRHSSGAMVYGSLRTADNNPGGNNVAGPAFEPYHWFWSSGDGATWSLAAKIRNFNNAATGNVLDLWEDSRGNIIAGVTFSRGTSWGGVSRPATSVVFSVTPQTYAPDVVVDV